MRGSIRLTCLAWVLLFLASAAISSASAPDSQELRSSLDEIDSGLLMTEAPLSEIGSYFESESERLQYERAELQKERERLQQQRINYDKRGQALIVREQDLSAREAGLSDMQASLEKANKRLKRARIGGIITVIAVAAAGALIGYQIGK